MLSLSLARLGGSPLRASACACVRAGGRGDGQGLWKAKVVFVQVHLGR